MPPITSAPATPAPAIPPPFALASGMQAEGANYLVPTDATTTLVPKGKEVKGGRRLDAHVAETFADVDLDNLEETDSLDDAAQSLPLRRLDADAHRTALKFFPVTDRTATNCAFAKELCTQLNKAFQATKSCACNGQAVNGTGGYCGKWDAGPQWCFVDPTVSATECPYLQANGANLYKSMVPCSGIPVSSSQALITGELLYQIVLVLGVLLGILSCGVFSLGTIRLGIGDDAPETMVSVAPSTMMMQDTLNTKWTLDEQFRWAQKVASANMSDATPEDTKNELYGYFHQAVDGDCPGARPGMFQADEQHRWDAWKRHQGMSRSEAMQRYIEAAQRLIPH